MNHLELLQEVYNSMTLTTRAGLSLKAALQLIRGLEVDKTSDDGHGHFNLMGSEHWEVLESFGFETPGYPREIEMLHEVVRMADGRVALSIEDVLAGKYFGSDGRVKIMSEESLKARLNALQQVGIIGPDSADKEDLDA